MAKPSKKSNETTLELTGKFGKLTKFLFGGSTSSKKDIFFNGKAKVVKNKDTASKIKPLKQGNDMLDILLKIYQFLNKNLEADKLHREVQNNFKEEQLEEDERRHKALLEAIKKLTSGKETKEDTAEKVDDSSGLFDSLFNKLSTFLEDRIFNRLLNKFSRLSLLADALGPGVANPLLGAYAVLLAPWMLAAYERYLIEQNPNDPKYKDNPYAMVIRGEAKTQGAAGAINTRKVTQKTAGGGGYVPTPEEAQNALDNATSESDLDAFGGRAKLQEIASQKKKVSPAPAPAPQGGGAAFVAPKGIKRKAVPVDTPSSDRINQVTTENNKMKVEAATAPPAVSTKNNVNVNTGTTERPITPRAKVPPVRNQEPTFQSMIIYSTRVV